MIPAGFMKRSKVAFEICLFQRELGQPAREDTLWTALRKCGHTGRTNFPSNDSFSVKFGSCRCPISVGAFSAEHTVNTIHLISRAKRSAIRWPKPALLRAKYHFAHGPKRPKELSRTHHECKGTGGNKSALVNCIELGTLGTTENDHSRRYGRIALPQIPGI